MKYFIKVFKTLLQKSLKLRRKNDQLRKLIEVSDNGLLSIMYKELLKLTKKKTTTPPKKMEKDINQFTRERQIICLYSFNQQVLNEHPLFPSSILGSMNKTK